MALGSWRVMSSPQLKTSLIPRLLIYWGRTPASKARKSLLYFFPLSRTKDSFTGLAATVSINNCRKIPRKKSAIYLVFISFNVKFWLARTIFMVDISHGFEGPGPRRIGETGNTSNRPSSRPLDPDNTQHTSQ